MGHGKDSAAFRPIAGSIINVCVDWGLSGDIIFLIGGLNDVRVSREVALDRGVSNADDLTVLEVGGYVVQVSMRLVAIEGYP